MLETVFLDAGGVLVYPNWTRISRALAARGVHVDPDALARAEPYAKKQIDERQTIATTTDAGRGWLYFNLIFDHAGVPPGPPSTRPWRSFTRITRRRTCGNTCRQRLFRRLPPCASGG